MASKTSKLAAFAAKPAASRNAPASTPRPTKGNGKTIGVTLRFDPVQNGASEISVSRLPPFRRAQ